MCVKLNSIRVLILGCIVSALSTLAQNTTGTTTTLQLGPINFAGYNNYVYRDNVTAAQIVVTE